MENNTYIQGTKGRDYSNGKHTPREWVKAMWGEWYIQLFCLSLFFFTYCFINLDGWDRLVCLIPGLGLTSIGYGGFYKFWLQYTGR